MAQPQTSQAEAKVDKEKAQPRSSIPQAYDKEKVKTAGLETLSSAENVAILDEDKKPKTKVGKAMQETSDELTFWWKKSRKYLCYILCAVLHILVIGHFIWATWFYIDSGSPELFFCDDYGFLIILFICFYIFMFYYYIYKPYLKEKVHKKIGPCCTKMRNFFDKMIVRWIVCGFIILVMLSFLIIDCAIHNDWERLIPLAGVFVILFLFVSFSKNPGYIQIKPIISGFAMQFIFGLITIRWRFGRNAFRCAGDKVADFLNYGVVGAEFVYSKIAAFAFTAMPIVYFVMAVVQILYYYGCVQHFVVGFGTFLQYILGTTIVESVNAAANIFLSMIEVPIMLAPYLPLLTNSELHCIITSGFSTVAGTVLAAYIQFGASPAHLIIASVMAAPASLVISKIFYPETDKSFTSYENIAMVKSTATNCLDAACQGAQIAIDIVLAVIANVIAFVSIIAFLDGILSWLGELVGQEDWAIVEFMAFIFMPIAFLMGIPWDETQVCARVIATKVVINEFVAYKTLGEMKKEQELTPRSMMILTYAICGFANPGAIGIMLSSLSILIPHKRPALPHIVIRAFIAATGTNFLTACICGMLTPNSELES